MKHAEGGDRPRRGKWVLCGAICACILVMGAALAACGSSGGSSSSGTTATTTDGGGSESTGSEGTGSKTQAEAKKFAEGFIGQPTPFPVDEPLKEKPKPGLKFAFMSCGTGVCAIYQQVVGQAVEAAGGEMLVFKAGTSASQVNAAFTAAVAKKPDVIINAGISWALWSSAQKEIEEAGIPVVTTGASEAENPSFPINEYPNSNQYGDNAAKKAAEVEANYAYGEYGDDQTYLTVDLPAIPVTVVTSESFKEMMEELCSDCTVNIISVQPEELGTTAPAKIISALQANPDTVAVVAGTGETYNGLPVALNAAGLSPDLILNGPTPITLNYLKEGSAKAVWSLDFGVQAWTMVDAGLRAAQGMPLSKDEEIGLPVSQLLLSKDVTFDPKTGWVGYPEFEERFEKLWKVGE